MDLILWRHADAQDGSPDLDRPLTAKGRKQAEEMAKWLRARLPEDARVMASPALRTVQTVAALDRAYEVVDALAPGEDAARLLHAAGWPQAKGTVLVVGHQPTLGEVASLLLFGETRGLSLKKGGLLWLTNRVRGDLPQTVLKAAMTPDLL
ncbi:MAG: histidine phosphatase family protein [Pseudomonadota bacterium]